VVLLMSVLCSVRWATRRECRVGLFSERRRQVFEEAGRKVASIANGPCALGYQISAPVRTTYFRISRAFKPPHRPPPHRPASADFLATVTMLIPKADRKKIHELVLLYKAQAQRNRFWNFARRRPISTMSSSMLFFPQQHCN
jgi:hypothetical protein